MIKVLLSQIHDYVVNPKNCNSIVFDKILAFKFIFVIYFEHEVITITVQYYVVVYAPKQTVDD